MVSIDRSREAPRFSAEFVHPLSCERPFKFPRHLVRPLGIDNIIAISDINIHSARFKLTRTRTRPRTRTSTRIRTETRTRTRTRTRTWTRTWTWTWKWNWNTFVRYPYSAIVPTALYGLSETHHGASSSDTMFKIENDGNNSYRRWNCSPNDVLAELETLVWG
jgi:hypothetical protein